jgi:hypothetical protein
MNPTIVGTAFGILGIAVVLFVIPPLFERMAGWALLAQRFAPALALPLTPIGFATLGALATPPVRLSASAKGLVLSLVFTPFRSTPPLLIPWRSLSEITPRNSFLIVTYTFASAPQPRLFVKPHVARRLRHYLAPHGAA